MKRNLILAVLIVVTWGCTSIRADTDLDRTIIYLGKAAATAIHGWGECRAGLDSSATWKKLLALEKREHEAAERKAR